MKRNLDSAMKNSVVEAKHDTAIKELSIEKKVNNKFDLADEVLGVKETKKPVEKIKPEVKPQIGLVKKDSFCFPEDDYNLIDKIKHRFLLKSRVVNKSEVLRIGLRILNEMSDKDLLEASSKIQKLKIGKR